MVYIDLKLCYSDKKYTTKYLSYKQVANGFMQCHRMHTPIGHDESGKYNAFGLVDMLGNVEEWVDFNGV